jgi:hypothetical protein
VFLSSCRSESPVVKSSQQQLQPGLQLLLREAVLAANGSGCKALQLQLLQLAAQASERLSESKQSQPWFDLFKVKLEHHNSDRQTAAIYGPLMKAHLAVLQPHLPAVMQERAALKLSSGDASGISDAPAAVVTSVQLAAAYLSLAALLFPGSGAVAVPSDQIDWQKLHTISLQQVTASAARQPCTAAAANTMAAAAAAAQAVLSSQQHLSAAACCMAAAAAAPACPTPWKAYGDLLFNIAGAVDSNTAADGDGDGEAAVEGGLSGDHTTPEQRCQQHRHVLLSAAAQAYCNHLAVGVNSQGSRGPELGLGVLLKLVQVMKQDGEQLQEQLQRALDCCPVAAWQVRAI